MNRLGAIACAALTGLLVGAIGCGPAGLVERPVTANQEPVATLVLADGQARVPVTATFGALDVDGSITHIEISWGDDNVDALAAHVTVAEHTYASAGVFDVDLAVTDDNGLVGRARTRIQVAPPPDATPPTITSLTVTRDGAPLAPGARVSFGPVEVSATASDAEGNLEAIDGVGTVDLQTEGEVALTVTARDSFGNVSEPATFVVTVLGPDSDQDGDGLVDLDDPEPLVFNGLAVELFTVSEELFAEDFVGRQRAEDVVEAVATAAASATWTIAAVDLEVPSATAPLSQRAELGELGEPGGLEGAGDVSELFALRYSGVLVAPAGATHVIVETAADDIGVVFIDGVAVASADEEYAEDFFRFNRAPVSSDPVALPAGGRAPLEVIVANGTGAYAWSVRFRFVDGDTTIMNPEAVSQRQFSIEP